MSCNMFDEDKKSEEGNRLNGSCWSKESCQLDRRNSLAETENVEHTLVTGSDSLHRHNTSNCESNYECDDSYHDGHPYLFSEIHDEGSQSYEIEELCRSDNSVSRVSHVRRKQDGCSEYKENYENSQPAVHNTEELNNCETGNCLSESNQTVRDDSCECNESHADSQIDDDNQSYRSTYTTDLSEDESLYYNSEAENDDDGDGDGDDDDDEEEEEADDSTRPLYIIECNSEEFLETRPSTGFATIIRAFSVWAEMEQFEKPPPPAAKEVIQSLENLSITEKGYQCPVCLGICEIGETLKLLPCTHAFHNECILPWLEKTNTCPLCRHEMPTDNEDYELFKRIETGRQLRN
ncbi:uncharacterized protein LOC126267376 isoform X1 [Schistocerca gregaria]|uniref:uncharacterized protein LOC126267376 isoform X1 n=2 Tax=Schistocerca gregaria TaxID=7010 RepID=UPI00211DBDB0|nr:uncharacterized protein LOC126267376 isoform X1 [Schistocerca gregaria]